VSRVERKPRSIPAPTAPPPKRTARAGPRSKRDQILAVATDYFGRYGYEETKWADVAAAVGIGSTALYHYFESKQHCLYEIMSRAVATARERFDRVVAANSDWNAALAGLLEAGFDLTEKDVLEYRVFLAEHGRLDTRRRPPREEAARKDVGARKRDYEAAWAAFLARGMEEEALPATDPQLLARTLLGLYNSVWTWYRPGGTLSLEDVGRFAVSRERALLGCREPA
jgi:TetR/AcrR family transcriptional regulator, cholesterol catabolism regulator